MYNACTTDMHLLLSSPSFSPSVPNLKSTAPPRVLQLYLLSTTRARIDSIRLKLSALQNPKSPRHTRPVKFSRGSDLYSSLYTSSSIRSGPEANNKKNDRARALGLDSRVSSASEVGKAPAAKGERLRKRVTLILVIFTSSVSDSDWEVHVYE